MEKIASEGRALVEQQAAEILGRPVQLEVRQIERRENARPAARRGHLAEAARALGAIPVGKEQ
ncbi:MAG: hypothetical protein IT304_06770 [Dehalococcoidia bacterium]|nr:hypothetical protein [Dehalococcoidia bacterium]